MVRIAVPATTANLGPGFDALGMALGIYNILEVERTEGPVRVDVKGEGRRELEPDDNNLVYRAARLAFEAAGRRAPSLRIRQVNRIPLARGLGSSAAAIVGGMVAANFFLDPPLPLDELLNLAAGLEGHPDNVTPALLGGVTISYMDGDRVIYERIKPPRGARAVVAIPAFPLPTSVAREVLPSLVPFQDACFNLGRVALLVAALERGNLETAGAAMADRLHQPYRKALVPGMEECFAYARKAGAKGVALSGSGPTVFALAAGGEHQIASEMGRAFREKGIDCQTLVCNISPRGAQVRRAG